MPDAHANFAYSSVLTAPSPASSGTSMTLQSGDGANCPSVPFNAVVWGTGARALVANAEIVRVTAISGDTLTITRMQEGTSARAIGVGDQFAAAITAKTLTDAEAIEPIYWRDEPMVIASGDLFVISLLVWTDATELPNLPYAALEPAASFAFWPGSVTEFEEDPFILDSGILGDLTANPQTVLWTDAARCPQVVHTLLVIGV